MKTRRRTARRSAGLLPRIGRWALWAAVLSLSSTAYAGPFGFTRIVNTFNTTPPSEPATTKYDYVGIPAYNAGQIVFGAKQMGDTIGGAGLYTRIDSSTKTAVLTRIAKQGANLGSNPPPNEIAFFFDDPVVSAGQVAVRTSAFDAGANAFRTKIFTYSGGSPAISGIALGPAAIYAGSLAFAANQVGVNSTQLSGTLVDINDFVPSGGGAKFQSFTPFGLSTGEYPDYNIDYAAFVARWTDSSNTSRIGIYRWQRSTDTIAAVADKNVSIPGFPLDRFDDNASFLTTDFDNVSTTGVTSSARPSLAGPMAAFSYDEKFSSPPRAGVYRDTNGILSKIADVTTLTPALNNAQFRHFEGVSTVGSATAFVANSVVSGTSWPQGGESSIGSGYGIYLSACGTLREVIREGQTLDGRIISNLELGHRGMTTSRFAYDLAFRAQFTDGTQGIYTATTSSLCFDLVSVLSAEPLLLGSSFAVAHPNHDVGVPVESIWQMRTIQGGAAIPAVLHADFEHEWFGVDGLPGNNPALIDYTTDGGIVSPEEISLSFDQDMELEGLHLTAFDGLDSAQLEVGGMLMRVDALSAPDGMIDLGNLLLPAAQAIHIRWDPANSVGDGFSFNGLAYTVVPEPGTLCIGVLLAVLGLRSRSGW